MDTLEKFSSGYYFGRAYMTPATGLDEARPATINSRTYTQLINQLFSTPNKQSNPLVFKIGSTHIPVGANEETPTGVIEISDGVRESLEYTLPSDHPFFVLTEERITQVFPEFETETVLNSDQVKFDSV